MLDVETLGERGFLSKRWAGGTSMDLPRLDPSHRLNSVLGSVSKRRGTEVASAVTGHRSFFRPEFFKLDQVPLFQAASPEQKLRILEICSEGLLRESHFIEKGGMFYTAKISLLSRSAEERMLYSHFSADEANHFRWISGFCSAERAGDHRSNPFLNLLAEVAESESRTTLIYILQVVLEGWGLHHYREMAMGCHEPALRQIFENILKDEAAHHGGGLTLFNSERVSDAEIRELVAILRKFLAMVQVGPQGVIGAVEAVLGRMQSRDRIEAFERLECEPETLRKIGLIKNCVMAAQKGAEILECLEKQGALSPFSAEVCAGLS